jgi:hypothetical protein
MGNPAPGSGGLVREFIEVDPRTLHLPPSRWSGADPVKLTRQIAKYGNRTDGMPTPFVIRGKGGELMLEDGVTRATRVARLLPGQTVIVEVTGNRFKLDLSAFPTVGDRLP